MENMRVVIARFAGSLPVFRRVIVHTSKALYKCDDAILIYCF